MHMNAKTKEQVSQSLGIGQRAPLSGGLGVNKQRVQV